MIQTIKKYVSVEYVDTEYIHITEERKARGACRWNFEENCAEIILAKSANRRTLAHELGHAINLVLCNGEKVSDKIGIHSERFANIVADILEDKLCHPLQ